MSVSFPPWQSTWLEKDPILVPKLEKAKQISDPSPVESSHDIISAATAENSAECGTFVTA